MFRFRKLKTVASAASVFTRAVADLNHAADHHNKQAEAAQAATAALLTRADDSSKEAVRASILSERLQGLIESV